MNAVVLWRRLNCDWFFWWFFNKCVADALSSREFVDAVFAPSPIYSYLKTKGRTE